MATVQIPVTKGGGAVEIDTNALPEGVYAAALLEGLKALVNKGMTKITTAKLEGADLAKAREAAMVKARENAAAMLDGTMKLPGQRATKAKGVSGAVNTEAMRIARQIIKDEMKRSGLKVSHYKASDISAAAKAYLATEHGPAIIEQAKANLAAVEHAPAESAKGLLSALTPDQGRVEAAAKKAAANKSEVSAKQSGMTKKHKPQAGARA